nr:putative glycoside hydrolase, family 28, pectin lyase fold/virulence factor [Tanacetum cinerariifolium]
MFHILLYASNNAKLQDVSILASETSPNTDGIHFITFYSIGTLGWDFHEAGVQNITVKTTTFMGTQNGVRKKAWARQP